jgi:hypothetical protein
VSDKSIAPARVTGKPVLIRAVRLSMDGGPAEMNSLYGSMTRKRRDLFGELQMCHDPGSYASSAWCGLRSKNRSRQESVWFLVPTLRSGVGKRLDQAASQGPLELAVGVEPELPEPGRLRLLRRAPKQL